MQRPSAEMTVMPIDREIAAQVEEHRVDVIRGDVPPGDRRDWLECEAIRTAVAIREGRCDHLPTVIAATLSRERLSIAICEREDRVADVAVERAAKAMWLEWGLGGQIIGSSWGQEGDPLCDHWRHYARTALATKDRVE